VQNVKKLEKIVEMRDQIIDTILELRRNPASEKEARIMLKLGTMVIDSMNTEMRYKRSHDKS